MKNLLTNVSKGIVSLLQIERSLIFCKIERRDQKYFSRTGGPQVTLDLKDFPFLKILAEDTEHLTFCLTSIIPSCFCRK